MEKGQIVKLMDKGFGFIRRDGHDKDLFFHANDVPNGFNELREGDSVTFEVVEGPKGLAAVNVQKA
jgi:CspA family cold shock protein